MLIITKDLFWWWKRSSRETLKLIVGINQPFRRFQYGITELQKAWREVLRLIRKDSIVETRRIRSICQCSLARSIKSIIISSKFIRCTLEIKKLCPSRSTIFVINPVSLLASRSPPSIDYSNFRPVRLFTTLLNTKIMDQPPELPFE